MSSFLKGLLETAKIVFSPMVIMITGGVLILIGVGALIQAVRRGYRKSFPIALFVVGGLIAAAGSIVQLLHLW